MIPWYKKIYQVAEDVRETHYSVEEIKRRLNDHFEKPGYGPKTFFQKPINPYVLKLKGDKLLFRQNNKFRSGIDPFDTGISLVKGELVDSITSREIRLTSQIPVNWIFGLLLAGLITYSVNIIAFLLSMLIGLVIIFRFRYIAKMDLEKIDIELYKCLKEK